MLVRVASPGIEKLTCTAQQCARTGEKSMRAGRLYGKVARGFARELRGVRGDSGGFARELRGVRGDSGGFARELRGVPGDSGGFARELRGVPGDFGGFAR